MELQKFIDSLEFNPKAIEGDLQKIADIHVDFYKYFIRFCSRSDAVAFDSKSRDYLESCIDFLQSKKVTKQDLLDSTANFRKMLDFLSDLCVSLGGNSKVMSKLYLLLDVKLEIESTQGSEALKEKVTDQSLDLLKQLKNILSEPCESDEETVQIQNPSQEVETSPLSPNSVDSEPLENEMAAVSRSIEPMAQYLLSDKGMDTFYSKYTKDLQGNIITFHMNKTLENKETLQPLLKNRYSGLDNIMSKINANVPIWNYNIDRVDSLDSNNVKQNLDIFKGNQSVIDAVLHSHPEFLKVGPFEVYHHNDVFVYHCLVNNCTVFKTTSIEHLKTHVKFNHCDSVLRWECSACDILNFHSEGQQSLDGALDHLAKYHSLKTTSTLSKERLIEMNQQIEKGTSELNDCPCVTNYGLTEYDLNLFQCPNIDCQFSTNVVPTAFSHFNSLSTEISIFECRICSYVSSSSHEYCKHLLEKHGNANFQCGHCSYRSVSKANIVFHQNDAHPGFSNKIYSIVPLELAEYRYDCRSHNSIKPFKCLESCNFTSFLAPNFNSHLQNHPGSAILCSYCSKFETSDISDLRDHLLLHGVGEYHCIYCKEAFNFIAKIQLHLYKNHPSQYPYVVICEDYEERILSLRGKYSKIKKLDIGGESLIVLSLDSDLCTVSIATITCQQTINVGVDHCKQQLMHFLKNTFEELPIDEDVPHQSLETPVIVDSVDLTPLDDEDARSVDVKPRLRLRNIDELMIGSFGNRRVDTPGDLFQGGAFDESLGTDPSSHLHQPPNFDSQPSTSGLAGPSSQCFQPALAKIKSEFISNRNDDTSMVVEQRQSSQRSSDSMNVLLPAAQIKKERNVEDNHTNRKIESPKKRTLQNDLGVSDVVRVKQEGHEEQAEERSELVIQSFQSLENVEDGSVVSANDSNQENEMDDEANRAAAIISEQPDTSLPILSAETIENVPVDFDCELQQTNELVDSKTLLRTPMQKYVEPTITDILVISDEEDDVSVSPAQVVVGTPSTNEFMNSPPQSILTPTPVTLKPTADALQGPKALFTNEISGSSGQVVFAPTAVTAAGHQAANLGGAAISVGRPTHIVINSSPSPSAVVQKISLNKPVTVVSTKRYRCKMCNFTTTEENIIAQHARGHLANTQNATVKGISCPYCTSLAYKNIKGFQTHHSSVHPDFVEVKCFIIFRDGTPQPDRLFICDSCCLVCKTEDDIWKHSIHTHLRLSTVTPLILNPLVALKKMVCPLHNCLEEFLNFAMFKTHMLTHQVVVACKACDYIVDSLDAFKEFHDKIDPSEVLTHFFYYKTLPERNKLIHVKRFSHPLYSLTKVILKDVNNLYLNKYKNV